MMNSISIGITTRNRPAALRRCLHSIAAVLPAADDILIFDDASDLPVADQIADPAGLRILRDQSSPGYIAGRNAIVRAARHEMVLLLDDDAVLLDREGIRQAVRVLESDADAGAVAFAQAEADGRPWPDGMQPAAGRQRRYVPSFIGFGHMLRRSLFLRLGGYREAFRFYGEEKDYCLRMLEAGFRTVYLPDALIGHVVDATGRDPRKYVRYAIRNDCLGTLFNDPWPLVVANIPLRFWRYRQMTKGIEGGDPGGIPWLARELYRAWPDVRRERRPVRWATVRAWQQLKAG